MKFGGAALATPQKIEQIARIIVDEKKIYNRCIVVLSAMGNTTNDLIALAKQMHPDPPQREYDMLITTGERISIALLAMALAKIGQKAKSFTGSQSGIITTEAHTNAKIINVKPGRLLEALDSDQIVIVAGFQGVSIKGEITTLGRGGSDTTAVALAVALNAPKVKFYKDVNGIFDSDPKIHPNAIFYSELTYQKAMDIIDSGAKILHKRAISLAKNNGILLHVRSFESDHIHGTIVGNTGSGDYKPIYESDSDPESGLEKL